MVTAAFLYLLVRDFNSSPDWQVVAVTLALALLGELIEFVTGVVGAKKQKVPTGAIIASMIGGIIGALVGVPVFLIGSFLGLLLGAYLGAFLYSYFRSPAMRIAFQHANNVLVSRMIATFFKTAIAVGIVIYLIIRAI